jgi:queuine tRNA-ribosyltransferase
LTDCFQFEIQARQGSARAGILTTPHGQIPTPIFAPVGTQASVKALTPQQLEELGARLILANTYHLFLRPGDELIAEMGGLHKFMNWHLPLLTDSGGYQVFSLAKFRNIDDGGVTFKSHVDGSLQRLTPEKSVAIQQNLGADIIMAFDECAPPYNREYNELALSRTHSWAKRCLNAKTNPNQALFGIVQGGIFPDLRRFSAEFITSLNFPGYAIGGLAVGETKEEMHSIMDIMDQSLPQDKPRYLMGVGTPEDLINGVKRGMDIFDCVLPTRLARHNTAMTKQKRINLVNAVYARDPAPIDDTCSCYTCMHFSRAYLRHLILAKEMLAATLLSIHNLYILMALVMDIRNSIINGQFDNLSQKYATA